MARLLLIDDDSDFLNVSSSLLKRKGFEVNNCNNLEDALAEIETFNPHIIILDVFLSGVDGLGICKKLKTNRDTSHIPVVVISGYPKCADQAVHDCGADDFIPKPFEISELVNKIHDILSYSNTTF